MAKSIRIFKSYEEQEQYRLQQMVQSTAKERFRNLYLMQQMTKLFHPITEKDRKIIIR